MKDIEEYSFVRQMHYAHLSKDCPKKTPTLVKYQDRVMRCEEVDHSAKAKRIITLPAELNQIPEELLLDLDEAVERLVNHNELLCTELNDARLRWFC